MAIIVPASLHSPIADALRRALADQVATDDATALERPVSVMEVGAVKGLEFDSVLVVEPAAIIAASPRGLNDLYVALTRTTNRLGLLHAAALPESLASARAVTTIEELG